MKWLALLFFLSLAFLNAADELPVDFVRQIKPIFADRCVVCHNSAKLFGDLSLQSREVAMRMRKNGAVIVPKQPDKSPLYLVLMLPVSHLKAMPATAHRLPSDELKAIHRWIEEGAPWPDGKEGRIDLPAALSK
jgi:mono/diheme cytochrome c family protein